MNKIVIARNGNGMVNSVAIIDDSILDPSIIDPGIENSTTTILSVPESSGEHGWIKNLHRVLLGKAFTYAGSVTADVSAIESVQHDIWKHNLRKFSAKEYAAQVIKTTMPHILRKIKLVNEIDEMIGETKSSSYFPISRLLSPLGLVPKKFETFNEFMSKNNVDGLVFVVKRVNKGDRNSIAEFAMCIFNMATRKATISFDPEDAVIALKGNYAFAGEMFVAEANAKSGIIGEQCYWDIDAKIHESISSMMSVGSSTNTLNALHL